MGTKGYDPTAGLRSASRFRNPAEPLALIGDDRITWPDLEPALAEAAGAEVLEEQVLSVLVRRELKARKLQLDERTIQAEREAFGLVLTRSVGASQDDRERLIADVRRRRGLGEYRFRSLLDRNAGLRMLIRSDPSLAVGAQAISPEDLATAYAIKYGPRVRVRIIVTPTLEEAERAVKELDQRPFSEVAAAASIDPSSQRGGLVEPLSLQDPSYPVIIRSELEKLAPGEVTRPLSVEWNGRSAVALIRMEERLPAIADAPSPEAAAPALRDEMRLVRERVSMDRLARRLLTAHPPTVLDRSLGWSWDNAHGPENAPRP